MPPKLHRALTKKISFVKSRCNFAGFAQIGFPGGEGLPRETYRPTGWSFGGNAPIGRGYGYAIKITQGFKRGISLCSDRAVISKDASGYVFWGLPVTCRVVVLAVTRL